MNKVRKIKKISVETQKNTKLLFHSIVHPTQRPRATQGRDLKNVQVRCKRFISQG